MRRRYGMRSWGRMNVLLLFLGFWLLGMIGGWLVPLTLTTDERTAIRDFTKTVIEQEVQAVYTDGVYAPDEKIQAWRPWGRVRLEMILLETVSLFLLSLSLIGWPLAWLYIVYVGFRFGWSTFFIVDAFGLTGLIIDVLIFLPLELFLGLGYALLILGARPYVKTQWPFFARKISTADKGAAQAFLTYSLQSVVALSIFMFHAWALQQLAYRGIAEIWLFYSSNALFKLILI
ncbi:MAG: hypothetical protein IMX04_06410 [Candidatus Carbobacillus altaicus]|nr:hypothetical protein [Candidatus Carbobacillus altaicus]